MHDATGPAPRTQWRETAEAFQAQLNALEQKVTVLTARLESAISERDGLSLENTRLRSVERDLRARLDQLERVATRLENVAK